MKLSLKQQLINYITRDGGSISSGSLQRIEWKDAKGRLYTPRSTVRRLEEAVNEGVLTVHYEKGHAYYSSKLIAPPEFRYEVRDGVAYKIAV